MGNFMRLEEVVYQVLKFTTHHQNLGLNGPALPNEGRLELLLLLMERFI